VKKLTTTVDNDLARPQVIDNDLLTAYREMSEDRARESEAEEWVEGLIEDSTPRTQ
jgi:hypothetical protein